MENIEQFISAVLESAFNYNNYDLCGLFKDICLINYKYKPRLDDINQVIYEWQHRHNGHILTTDFIRKIFDNELYERFRNIQSNLLLEAQQLKTDDENHKICQKKVKKLAEICVRLRKVSYFKAFIDNYRLGYYN